MDASVFQKKHLFALALILLTMLCFTHIVRQAWASSLRPEYHSCDQSAKLNKSAMKCRETSISVLP